MSFFVSKELENRVDENCLLEEPKKSVFALSHDNSDFNIEEIVFDREGTDLSATISFITNLSKITGLVFEDCSLEIKLSNRNVKVDSHKIIKLKRNAEDSYLLTMRCKIEKGFTNV